MQKYDRYSSNVGLIKFIAAILVIVSHSFSLSTGGRMSDALDIVSFGQSGFGRFAVWIFFFYSGFYVTKSILKNGSNGFVKRRLIRLVPPLLTVVFSSILILGILFSTYSFSDYFLNKLTWKYLLNAMFIPVHCLPGVFENNIFGATVNGALWTMPIEMLCYLVCYFMYKLKLLEKGKMKILWFGALAAIILLEVLFWKLHMDLYVSVGLACISFFSGMFYYIIRDEVAFSKKTFVIALLGFLLCNLAHIFFVGMFFCFTYILVYLAFAIENVPKRVGKLGEYSYGIYLVGFPVQQSVVACFGGTMNPFVNMAIAIPVSIILGIVIYNCIEKKI